MRWLSTGTTETNSFALLLLLLLLPECGYIYEKSQVDLTAQNAEMLLQFFAPLDLKTFVGFVQFVSPVHPPIRPHHPVTLLAHFGFPQNQFWWRNVLLQKVITWIRLNRGFTGVQYSYERSAITLKRLLQSERAKTMPGQERCRANLKGRISTMCQNRITYARLNQKSSN